MQEMQGLKPVPFNRIEHLCNGTFGTIRAQHSMNGRSAGLARRGVGAEWDQSGHLGGR